ncbi:MAG: LysE family translocator [Alphaproteobacteria bacterium]|nr:LysE family translocator [Alphaproteobacteria bacterium]MBO6862879.1 LysE family translocator [Alphaproteobacteria bacterium]
MVTDSELLLALISFALVTSITPGPNNLMAMASGAAFGWFKTVPHLAGIAFGFSTMIGAVVLGLGVVLSDTPMALQVLRFAGAAWMAWLAWQLAKAGMRPSTPSPEGAAESAARPMRFHEAAMFQWVNPKAWTMAIGASAAYSGISETPLWSAMWLVGVFVLVGPACNSVWVLAGQSLKRLTMSGVGARYFSFAMAALVAFNAVLILLA